MNDAKEYFDKYHGLHLIIPASTINPGRYVQFPKSQSLLNTEDLKSLTLFFSGELRIKEEIPFNFFRELIENNLINIKLNKRAKFLIEDSKIELCYHQIYNFYNKWRERYI